MNYKMAEHTLSKGLQNATGRIRYTFMNDYMFRVILQRHKKVLICLICAVLKIKKEDVLDITILNPIKHGESIDDKTFILDINVLLNSNTIINLEMQILNNKDWPERSLSYLARNYDNAAKGSAYIDVKPVYHIGFLDYTLFPEYPEFYAKYMMLNIKNHNIYTTKFNLYVIDLTKIDMATKEDRAGDLIYWTRLFKATTWEDLRQMAEKNQDCMEAAEALYEYNQDEVVRQQCRAREDYYIREKIIAKKMEEQNALIQQLEENKRQKEALISTIIKLYKKMQMDDESIIDTLVKEQKLDKKEAQAYTEKYGHTDSL